MLHALRFPGKLLGLLLLAITITVPAAAQDFDLDEDVSRKSAKNLRQRDFEKEIVREIERGWYLKASVGSTIYFVTHPGGLIKPGTTVNLTVGRDVLDKERISAGIELIVGQALHNGASYLDQDALLDSGQMAPTQLVQGDIHSFSVLLAGEFSGYPLRRFGIGARIGGGVMMTPLLMGDQAWVEQVVANTWGLASQPAVHQVPHPVVLVGPTFEYYTKLSHFSLGLDADFLVAIGFDMGMMITGYFKYTF